MVSALDVTVDRLEEMGHHHRPAVTFHARQGFSLNGVKGSNMLTLITMRAWASASVHWSVEATVRVARIRRTTIYGQTIDRHEMWLPKTGNSPRMRALAMEPDIEKKTARVEQLCDAGAMDGVLADHPEAKTHRRQLKKK